MYFSNNFHTRQKLVFHIKVKTHSNNELGKNLKDKTFTFLGTNGLKQHRAFILVSTKTRFSGKASEDIFALFYLHSPQELAESSTACLKRAIHLSTGKESEAPLS